MTQAKTLVSSSRIRDFAWSMFPGETAKVAARPAFAEENKLPVAAVENKAGKFVLPTGEGASAAIDELSKDIRTSIVDRSASAANAYPISG